MKRLLLVFFAGLLPHMPVFAQWDSYDDDDDEYYDEQTADPGVTNFTVTNSGTEDVSEQKLTLPNSQPIYLYFYNTVQNPTPPEPQSPSPPPAPSAPKEPPPREPEPLIEYRYVPAPASTPEPLPPPPVIEYRYLQPPPVEYIYIQSPQPQIEYVYIQPPAPEPVYVPQMSIRVIPGLPDPNSARIYRIQVGSYAVHNTADIMAQRLNAAGLYSDFEFYNSLKRVIVPGIRASDAFTVVQMLESLGFAEVWIRE